MYVEATVVLGAVVNTTTTSFFSPLFAGSMVIEPCARESGSVLTVVPWLVYEMS